MMNNGLVHMVSTIVCNVMSSKAEAEFAALYLNAKYGVIIRNLLEVMGHPNATMPLHTEHSTSERIFNRTIVQI